MSSTGAERRHASNSGYWRNSVCISYTPYEGAIQEAGFREFAWHPTEVAPEDIARYGAAYWRDLHDNGLVIGLVCKK